MNTLEFLKSKYEFDENQDIVKLPIGRWRNLTYLLKEIGFKKGVEVGVYRGHYSEALMRVNPKLDLTGVDAWKVYRGYKDYTNPDLENGVYEDALARANHRGFKLIKAFSMDAVQQFEKESLDFVFIDSNHDFRHVTEDVEEWSKRVRKDGIVSGHDFFEDWHEGYGVREAVTGWCQAYRIKPLFVLDREPCPSWMYIKP
jgi:hypothetical protein